MPKLPRVGPRNPCSPFPYGFSKGVTSVHVKKGASRGVTKGRGQPKTGKRLFHVRYNQDDCISRCCCTTPRKMPDVRSTRRDNALALQEKKQRIQEQCKRNKELRRQQRD